MLVGGPKLFSEKPPVGTQLNRGHPLATGLAGAFLFNEGGGQLIFDLVSQNVGVLIGTTVRKATIGGNGLAINLVSGRGATVPDRPQYDMTTDLSIIFWGTENHGGALPEAFITKGTAAYEFDAETGSPGSIRFNRDNQAVILGPNFVPVGMNTQDQAPSQFALAVRPSLNTIYLQGGPLGSNTTAPALSATTTDLHLGADSSTAAKTYWGTMTTVLLFNRALLPCEVLDNWTYRYAYMKPQVQAGLRWGAKNVTAAAGGVGPLTSGGRLLHGSLIHGGRLAA